MTTTPNIERGRGVFGTFWGQVLSKERQRAVALVLLAAAIVFPFIDGNEGDIDAAANATAFAILALGLNIVVGFAGLLDLGYAAVFAIGAYAYGILSSYQVTPPWNEAWEPLQWLGLVSPMN